MVAIDPEKAAKAWATATPLHEFIEQETARQCRETLPDWPTDWTPEDDSRGSYLRLQQWRAKQNPVQALTTYELLAGRLIGFGRMSDSNVIEFVSEAFWDGADTDWKNETAKSREGRVVSEIRVVAVDALKLPQPAPRVGPGRPSIADVLLPAIAACAKADPVFFRRPPSERRAAYKSYFLSLGVKLNKDLKIGSSTFEKYEQIYRDDNQ
jgi:hypothetical protein